MEITPSPVTQASRTRHRTLVALPLFAVLLIGTMMQGAIVRGDIIGVTGLFHTKQERTALPLPNGGQAVLMPGAEAMIEEDDVVLSKGEIVLAHASLASLKAGEFMLQGWNGAFGATLQGGSLTVIALTTPVLVHSGEAEMIVPIGSQARLDGALPILKDGMTAWTLARGVLPLPAHYVRERLEILQDLTQPTVAVRGSEGDWSMPPVLDTLRLPSARVRSAAEVAEQHIGNLFAGLRMSDGARVQTALLDEELQTILRDTTDPTILPDAVSLASKTALMPLFLPLALREESFRLIASAHPLLRDHAWVTAVDSELSAEGEAALLFVVPRSDVLPEAMSSLSVQGWQEQAITFLADHRAAKTLDAFVRPWADVVLSQANNGFTERTQRYTDAILAITAPYAAALAPETLSTLEALVLVPQQLTGVRFEGDASSASSQESSASSQETSSSAPVTGDGVAAAVEALNAAGGMQTPHTTFSAMGPTQVHVVAMVFATDAGDLPFEFTFDPATGTVSEILKDGKILPYAVTLQDFVEWVKKGMK